MAHASSSFQRTQMALDPADRPRYTPAELQAYFQRIRLPAAYTTSPILQNPALAQTTTHGLPLLRALVLHHLATIPFENLELHYSARKRISLHMDDLYRKFVLFGDTHGRGGRCMEQNGFFGTVLRSLGFDVRNAAGRVSRAWNPDPKVREQQGDSYDPWNHMLNLVRFDAREWWVVDVGMGAMGPALVYPLQDGVEVEANAPRRLRLRLRAIPEHAAAKLEEAPRLWCYDVCLKPELAGTEEGWTPTYCFTETEFLPQDYEMMSWYTSTHPHSFFTFTVLCTRLLMDEAGEKIIGDITLVNDTIRKTVGGKREVIRELTTEQERVQALKEILGVELTDEEREGISPTMRLR